MKQIYEPCEECGNKYYFTVIKGKIICDICIARGKLVETKEREK